MSDSTFPLPPPVRIGKCLTIAVAVGLGVSLLGFDPLREAIAAFARALHVAPSLTFAWAGITVALLLALWCLTIKTVVIDHPKPPLLPADPENPDLDLWDFTARARALTTQSFSELTVALNTYRQRMVVGCKMVGAIFLVSTLACLTSPEPNINALLGGDSFLLDVCIAVYVLVAANLFMATILVCIIGSDLSEGTTDLERLREITGSN